MGAWAEGKLIQKSEIRNITELYKKNIYPLRPGINKSAVTMCGRGLEPRRA